MSAIALGARKLLSPSLGERARSIEYRNVSAVTGWFEGGEKR